MARSILAAVLALALAGCAAGVAPATLTPTVDSTASPSPTPDSGVRFTEEDADQPPPGAVELTLTFGPKFVPDEAATDAGTVVFFLTNDPGDGPPVAHNFLLGREQGEWLVKSDELLANQSVVLTVTGLTPGEYVYWCSVAEHHQFGMTGTLTVRS